MGCLVFHLFTFFHVCILFSNFFSEKMFMKYAAGSVLFKYKQLYACSISSVWSQWHFDLFFSLAVKLDGISTIVFLISKTYLWSSISNSLQFQVLSIQFLSPYFHVSSKGNLKHFLHIPFLQALYFCDWTFLLFRPV